MPKTVKTDVTNITNADDNVFDDVIKDEIKHIEEEEKSSEYVIDFSTFISTFNIFQVALGTILGYAVNRLISDLSSETLQPIVKKILFYDFIDEINIVGMKFDIKKIISSVIYFILIIVVLYFVFTYVFSTYITKVVADNKKEELTKIKNELYTILLQKKSYDTLKKIEESLDNQNALLSS